MDFRGRQKALREALDRQQGGCAGGHASAQRALSLRIHRQCGSAACGPASGLLHRWEICGAGLCPGRGARVSITKGFPWRLRLQPASSWGSSALPSSPSTSPWLSSMLLSRRWARESKSSGLAGAVEQLRALKDADEIELLRNAVELSSKLFRPLLQIHAPGPGRIGDCRQA